MNHTKVFIDHYDFAVWINETVKNFYIFLVIISMVTANVLLFESKQKKQQLNYTQEGVPFKINIANKHELHVLHLIKTLLLFINKIKTKDINDHILHSHRHRHNVLCTIKTVHWFSSNIKLKISNESTDFFFFASLL